MTDTNETLRHAADDLTERERGRAEWAERTRERAIAARGRSAAAQGALDMLVDMLVDMLAYGFWLAAAESAGGG